MEEGEENKQMDNLNNKISLKHSKIYEESREEDDLEGAYYDSNSKDNKLEENSPID